MMHFSQVSVEMQPNPISGLWEATIKHQGAVIARHNELLTEQEAGAWAQWELRSWVEERERELRLVSKAESGLWLLLMILVAQQVTAALFVLFGSGTSVPVLAAWSLATGVCFVAYCSADFWVPWLQRWNTRLGERRRRG